MINIISIIICFYSIEPISNSLVELKDAEKIEMELNALRRTIPGEPGKNDFV